MEILPYWVTGIGAVVAVVIVGGWMWALTVIAVLAGVGYPVLDRRRETPGERRSSDLRAGQLHDDRR